MAYIIEGKHCPLVYCANYRVGSCAIGTTLLNMGGRQIGVPKISHHALPGEIPSNSVMVQTVRNHFDVIVSFWYKDQITTGSFADYVQKILDGNHKYLQPYAFYDRFGEWDLVMPYERLQIEFNSLCKLVGLPETKIEKSKTFRPADSNWKHLFSKDLENKVADRYYNELGYFDYGSY